MPLGVFVEGSHAKIEATVVRSTQPVNGQFGWGIGVQDNPATGERADVTSAPASSSRTMAVGVFVAGSAAEIEATVVRSTQPVNEQFGWGIGIQDDPATGERADVSIRACLVEQNHDMGVFVGGSAAELEAAVVRSTQPGERAVRKGHRRPE